ncbi:FimB/Mfa2 family fimbrial subunit [Bacteroides sp. 519]|uniref:FimB/Mfa2 family fimbrial subunit n=1 Tax=Bacteroides sp. 519 TaxID=2302937 RepID=UPI0013D17523|nr:FimB/Mfa2 family fimbrial subunit [Bacteroides sp. 519]NDV59531.1 hypothetical protein [Bacteroides sp. 519]
MQNLRKIYLFLILAPVWFTGCIGEEDYNCDEILAQGLTVDFLYNINSAYKDSIRLVADYIDLYIYTELDELYKEVRLSKSQLETHDYKYTTRLPKGVYKLVSWMNNGDCYHKENFENYTDARVRIKSDSQQLIDENGKGENTTPLYYGYVDRQPDYAYEKEDLIVEIKDEKLAYSKTINFAKNTNYIHIYTQFNRSIHAEGDVKVEISGKNGVCTHYNRNDIETNSYTYYPYATEIIHAESGYYYTHLSHTTTQRLWEGDELDLSIVLQEPNKADKVLVQEKLTELLMECPRNYNDFQLERFDHYNIIFQFDLIAGAWVMVDIIVDDWHLIRQDENVGVW